jgi:hypothetical protein
MADGIACRTYDDAFAITPSDTVNDANGPFAGLYVTTAGSLKIQTSSGNVLAMAGVVLGHLDIRTVRVFATGTSATVIGLKAVP